MGSEWVRECSNGDCGLGGFCCLSTQVNRTFFLSFFLFVLKSSNDISLFVCAGSLE